MISLQRNVYCAIHPGDSIKFSTGEFTLLSDASSDATIISKKHAPLKPLNSYIVLNEIKVDPNETAIQLDYPLPVGWPADDDTI